MKAEFSIGALPSPRMSLAPSNKVILRVCCPWTDSKRTQRHRDTKAQSFLIRMHSPSDFQALLPRFYLPLQHVCYKIAQDFQTTFHGWLHGQATSICYVRSGR